MIFEFQTSDGLVPEGVLPQNIHSRSFSVPFRVLSQKIPPFPFTSIYFL